MKITKFNKDFLVGSATSGPQTESGFNKDNKSESVWDYWHKTKVDNFFDNNNVKDNIRDNFRQYVDKVSELNLDSFRTSIQWTRLVPDGDKPSSSAIKFYREYFSYIKSKNIKVMVNLYHFDTPMWLYERGGFENRDSIKKYIHFAEIAFKEFGDLVDVWFTFNEPMVPIEMGYMNTYHLPATIDIKKGMQVMHHYLMCHMNAVESFKKLNLNSEIGIILNITPVMPKSDSKEDVNASEFAENFFYKCFADPIFKGKYPDSLVAHAQENGYMWEMTNEDIRIIKSKQSVDLIGLNYYQPRRIKAINSPIKFSLNKPFEGQVYESYKYPDAIINKHRGWEIYPKGIYNMLKNIMDEYDNPTCYIAENGIGIEGEDKFRKNGTIDDQYRVDFYREHLNWIHKAIEEGSNCIGYHIWTIADNWSWLNAYKNRYGVVELDINTQEYKNKKSFEWFKNFAKTKEYENE